MECISIESYQTCSTPALYASLNTALGSKIAADSSGAKPQHPWHYSLAMKHFYVHVKIESSLVIFFWRKAMSNKRTNLAGTQFEMKIKPPCQAQEWSYSSNRESIGKALSSPDIRSNKKTHINCGSPARMAGNVCANVDQIRHQSRWNNTTINSAYLTNLPRELVRSMAGFPTYGRFFYRACAALNPPTSLQEVVPGDRRMTWPTGGERTQFWRPYSTCRR
ncbi:hypothetical protein [Absidia glauca]|uniref:Uncharacterized protein n=1 Tax=Absidia glauca TaxID=4829 RepID=A0A168MUE7_ABSGL|nr:hypothetical protein [Absidia glauca]